MAALTNAHPDCSTVSAWRAAREDQLAIHRAHVSRRAACTLCIARMFFMVLAVPMRRLMAACT